MALSSVFGLIPALTFSSDSHSRFALDLFGCLLSWWVWLKFVFCRYLLDFGFGLLVRLRLLRTLIT